MEKCKRSKTPDQQLHDSGQKANIWVKAELCFYPVHFCSINLQKIFRHLGQIQFLQGTFDCGLSFTHFSYFYYIKKILLSLKLHNKII